ncbi:MAG: glutamine synthetase family protein [bacterium]|nr:glutamine synthetase family protein [bacterium]
MNHDKGQVERVTALIKKAGIRFINLHFTDISGIVKSVGIPVSMWQDVLDHGQWFDGSSIQGFARIAESDMMLVPDLPTFVQIPWDEDVPTARVICDVHHPDGSPFEGDPRRVLRRMVLAAEAEGFTYFTGTELEFFLFKPQPDGSLLPLLPQDRAGYFDVSTDLAHTVRRHMVDHLVQLGLEIEALHHEVAIGQHEINFKYDKALATADKAITLRLAVKAVAQKHGLYATFMPKPIHGENGSGMHTNQSLWQNGRNAFIGKKDQHGLSELAKHFIAGQLSHARAMSAVIAPLVNSYKRLVPGYEAPVYVSWASQNRSALIRVPRISPGRENATRIELRCPDPSANPYLAFAVMLAAGLDGVKNKLPAPRAAEEDLFHVSEARRMRMVSMPGSLGEAVREYKKSRLIRRVFGDDLFQSYLVAKTKEWDAYRTQVTQWELDRYLAIY